MIPTMRTRAWVDGDPIRTLAGLSRELDRAFAPLAGGEAPVRWPAEIRETENGVRIDLEAPGIRPEDVEITLEDGVLTVAAEKKTEEAQEQGEVRLSERRYGRFERSFRLPTNLDADAVKADYAHGVLRITLPKKEEAKPRRITVNVTEPRRVEQGDVG